MFLEYVYGGVLDEEGLTTEHLTELLTLADRYEVRHTDVVSEGQTCSCTWLYFLATPPPPIFFSIRYIDFIYM